MRRVKHAQVRLLMSQVFKNEMDEQDEDDAVAGGTEAMRAYQRIRFDNTLDINQKNEIKRQLIEYCKLDTMAMVIIAHHWGLKQKYYV